MAGIHRNLYAGPVCVRTQNGTPGIACALANWAYESEGRKAKSLRTIQMSQTSRQDSNGCKECGYKERDEEYEEPFALIIDNPRPQAEDDYKDDQREPR